MFWNLGHKITGHDTTGSRGMGHRKFRTFFGTTPQICAIIWSKMSATRPDKASPEHLLWALLLLKLYNIESINAALTGVSEKTFRKWSLIFIRLLASLPVVKINQNFLLL